VTATLISVLSAVSAGLLFIPISVFLVEVIAAIAMPSRKRGEQRSNPLRERVAVLIPAHNESAGVLPTIADVQKQLRRGDRLLVVADNCTDDTADVALAAGAEVVQRHDSARHGKGFALVFGLAHFALDPPAIVVVVDADCRLENDAIDELTISCAMTSRPVQALYLMAAPDDSGIEYRVAEFAWRVKNWLRPLGLKALRLPCQLMGSGMAVPWQVIQLADLAHGGLVEDLKLGLDLASVGYPPVFCPSARVTSQFASSAPGVSTQRARWEHGHINTILTSVGRLLSGAILRRNWALLALALDLAVPPLSLLSILVAIVFILTGLAAFLHFSPLGLAFSAADAVLFLLATFLAWFKCGREVLPFKALLLIAPYVFEKFGLYLRVLSNRMDAVWIRTDRAK
jgi:cellulose synthase/poly-beta-1,6-N-acetylglucosamine synthase-like glycosyltransferase